MNAQTKSDAWGCLIILLLCAALVGAAWLLGGVTGPPRNECGPGHAITCQATALRLQAPGGYN